MKIAVLGCGNWGSVFAVIQSRNGHQVRVWEFNCRRARLVQKTRDNRPFLTGYRLPVAITISPDLRLVLSGAELTVFAVPCQVLPGVVAAVRKTGLPVSLALSLIKGIDIKSLRLPSSVIFQGLADRPDICVLSGPSIANEIIRGEPTAVILVGPKKPAQQLQQALATRNLRIYLGRDTVGVELAGAAKNVIAIAAGICEGLGFGTNIRGALIARGLVELQRLGICLGARPETFWGLAGVGDLITTAFSEESRNHRAGRFFARGLTIGEIRRKMVMVAEGIPTARALHDLAGRHGVEMPICETVYRIIYQRLPVRKGLHDLMNRPLKDE